MNVIRAHRILSLATTPTEESDEALEQVHADHRGEMNDASHTDSDTPSPQSARLKPQPVRTGSTPVGVRSTRERERQPSLSHPVEWLHSHPWWQSAMQAPGHRIALWACLALYAGYIGLGAVISALLAGYIGLGAVISALLAGYIGLGAVISALLGMLRRLWEQLSLIHI